MDTTDPVVLRAIEAARQNVQLHEELVPMWFIGSKDNFDMVATPFTGPDEQQTKNTVVLKIKQMAAERDADFLLFISEAWSLKDAEAIADYTKNPHKYPNGVVDHPARVEVVVVTLETHENNYVGMARILPGRVMATVEWGDGSHRGYGGRFDNMLPPRGPVRENADIERR